MLLSRARFQAPEPSHACRTDLGDREQKNQRIINRLKREDQVEDHTATWVPTSTTRPVGIWKKSVASLAERARPMNSRSCQAGMPDCADALSERRERKNEVDMMSNDSP